MSKHDLYSLKIDNEFVGLDQPLSHNEYQQLEERLINFGCQEPITVWNETVIDGHNRYEICKRLQIPYKMVYVFLKSRDEAISWICTNQLLTKKTTINKNMIEDNYKYSNKYDIIPKNLKTKKLIAPFMQGGSIKDMPKYDPDAEISSLALTIPSWISLVERILTTANFVETSSNACRNLERELNKLTSIVDTLLLTIWEKHDER